MDTIHRVKELMNEANVGKSFTEKSCGLANGVILKWEKGLQKPSTEAVIEMAKFFNTTTDYLLGLTFEKRRNDMNLESYLKEVYKDLSYRDSHEMFRKVRNSMGIVTTIKLFELCDFLNLSDTHLWLKLEFSHLENHEKRITSEPRSNEAFVNTLEGALKAEYEIFNEDDDMINTSLEELGKITKLEEIKYYSKVDRYVTKNHKTAFIQGDVHGGYIFYDNQDGFFSYIDKKQLTNKQTDDVPTLLDKLFKLNKSGAITDEEFQAKKTELLSRI